MVKRKSRPQTIEEKTYVKPEWRHLAIGSENYSGKKFSYMNDLSMSVNCLIWRGGGMVDTRDFEKLSLLLFGNLKINAYICVWNINTQTNNL